MNKGMRFSLCLFLIFTLSIPLTAQMRRATAYFNNLEYAKAIPFYEKALKSKEDAQADANLALCYKMMKQYDRAEYWYAKSVSGTQVNPINYFYYGQVLRNNNKTEEARKQFELYIAKTPGDKSAESQLLSCKELKSWLGQSPAYTVKNEKQLNSSGADFAPVFFDKGLVFTSDRTAPDLLESGNDPASNASYLALFYASFKTQATDSVSFNQPKSFKKGPRSDYHTGPVAFDGAQQNMAYNAVEKERHLSKSQFVNRPKLFICHLEKDRFNSPVPFPFNSNTYSVAHPAFSEDGRDLFFSSDMPGGYGGKDLYVSHREGDTWGKPENLGPDVNTAKEEEFPYLRKDGLLFFSSDGHPGFGGLDIFSTKKSNKGKWTYVTNQGAPLNGPTDDFSIVFNENGSTGYFSSDRPGGKGNDDIYSFVVNNKFIRVAGKLLYSRDLADPAKGISLIILTETGKIIKVTTTDKNGFFKFENLPADASYSVKLDEEDPQLKGKNRAYITDEKDNVIRVMALHKGPGHQMVFKNLPADPNAPPELYTAEDLVNIAGNLLAGTNPAVALAGKQVVLKNDKGEIVQITTTNAFGAFAFKNLPPDQNFTVSLEENDTQLAPNTKITITNKSGKEIASVVTDSRGKFKYKLIPGEKNAMGMLNVADTELRLDLKGKLLAGDGSNLALANTTLRILNEKGELVQTVKTDAKGYFQFANLPSDQNYVVSIGEGNDPQLSKLDKLILTDGNGHVLRELKVNKTGKFDFKILPADQSTLGTVYVDDPWLKVLQLKQETDSRRKDSITIIENIYYAFGDWKILPDAENILAKVIQVMKNDPRLGIEVDSHTDSRASSEFNMNLSVKRAKTAVDYIVAHGIAASRIKGVGFGESRLLNKCADGVECTDDEHAKNRRTEFKITRGTPSK
jgi:outer membrane protein OmpA-like peptidoglycan-associated protein